ncbi:glycosyltransferase [Pelagibacterium nitratireducens]|uniref:Glycosyltransferase n=1 Tax=Pelagibacterium nitratireducens TaxID=1046114 RepID=A0ABZ2I027_9HYPH
MKDYSFDSGTEYGFSVIVPVFEQWDLIPGLLSDLEAQNLVNSRFEIILVDNGSERFEPPSVLPSNVSVLKCEAPGSYSARNYGVAHSEGEWLIFTDADCRPAPDWLSEFQLLISKCLDQNLLLAGAIEMVPQSKHPNSYEVYDMVRGIRQERYVKRGYGATANLAVPRAAFNMLGGFDSSRFSGGDADFCRRSGAKGYVIQFVPQAVVYHPARSNWQEISTKARRVKGGQIRNGSRSRRVLWTLLTLAPPIRNIWQLMRTPRRSVRHRLTAAWVQLKIWSVEVRELARLLLGAPAERR